MAGEDAHYHYNGYEIISRVVNVLVPGHALIVSALHWTNS